MEFELIFGGTFDPVHRGHLAVIQALHQSAPNMPVRLLPCAMPPLKKSPSTTFTQRCEMLSLATAEYSSIIIDKREELRERPSYTIETLNNLQQELPEKNFILVIGMDNLQIFKQWHQWQTLHLLCHLIVVNRDVQNQLTTNLSCELQSNDEDMLKSQCQNLGFTPVDQIEQLVESSTGRSFLLKIPNMPQSSTEIRQMIRNRQALDVMLPESIIKYIHLNHLYESE
ncbi:nicotinate (nicotinamide) nucleotide adenylyltransferase [Aliikangiella maris]|uniref:Nicotinate (Nicotinamide) nucleotide adenylyltransferase n=2 Tax=Aliikangiella maris TaxID=3162458 RepID=A0ABV3MQ15_9GAMM